MVMDILKQILHVKLKHVVTFIPKSVADPGFPVGGAPTRLGGGANL